MSVCIPTRNRAGFLREALLSVLGQDLADMEVLVYDDASDDATPAVPAELADSRIVYHRHREPVGIVANRNACLEAARGRYLAWLDDDDAYLPEGLAGQVALLEEEPDVVLAHGAIDVVDAEGRPQPAWPTPFEDDAIETGTDAFGELLLRNYVRAPTAVTRARVQRAVGPYADRLGGRAEDWDMWLRLALEGDVAFRATPVARYRCHAASVSVDRASSLAWLASETRVVRSALERARGRHPEAASLRAPARAALAARRLEAAADALVRGREGVAYRAVRGAGRLVPELEETVEAAAAHARRGDEHRFHHAARTALRHIAKRLEGSRYGASLRAVLEATDAWSGERALVARRIRRVVPRGARVAAVDKWDPSLLHQAGRRGWHFPDLALSPEGYPADDRGAIRHLEAQRSRGADYLVVPRVSFWWLEHYVEFSSYLDRRHDRVWGDEVCVIYRLAEDAGGVA